MLTKREVAMISFFASIFYAVNVQISLVCFGYIANGINQTSSFVDFYLLIIYEIVNIETFLKMYTCLSFVVVNQI